MNKKIEDYLPYYIGQDIQIPAIEEGAKFDIMKLTYEKFKYDLSKVKLYLRPLSSMTHEEAAEIVFTHNFYGRHSTFDHEYYRGYISFKVIYENQHRRWGKKINPCETAEMMHYLLKRGFDLFGLIEAGLAIDKTKEVK